MTTTTAIITQVKSSEEQKFLSGSDSFPSFKTSCGSLLSPLYAPTTDKIQQFENNMVWEPLGAKKSFDLNEYFNLLINNEPILNTTSTSTKAFPNPSYVNSLYYDHLINGGGSFNNGSSTKFNGCTTDSDHDESLGQQQNPLYSIALAKPLIIPSPSAWSSLEDLTTPTTATTNSTVTSRCSTPATSGWSFNEHTVDSSDVFVAQQQKDITPLKSLPSFQNFQALKRPTSMVDSSQSPLGNGVQVVVDSDGSVHTNNNNNKHHHSKVRRSSNTTVISDTTSEQSEKSTTIEAEKEQKKATLYKTEMCRNWEERGSCRYGSKCQFAHSETELRKVQHHPKYKTEICKTFWQNGTCPYGKRCCFIHNDKERLLLCKRRNSADNLKNSNKKEKSKGLSKFGSDPALYGTYLNDSTNPSADASIPSPPLMKPAVTTSSSSSKNEVLAFADAYFSSNNITLSPDTVSSNASSIHDDETVVGSACSSVNSTPTKKKSTFGFKNYDDDVERDDEIPIPSGFADKPMLLSELLNEAMDESISPKFDKNARPQAARRRASSTTSCKLEKSLNPVTKIDALRERSISMSANVKSGDRVINPSALTPQLQSQQQRGSRLAIFRNLNRG